MTESRCITGLRLKFNITRLQASKITLCIGVECRKLLLNLKNRLQHSNGSKEDMTKLIRIGIELITYIIHITINIHMSK